MKLSLLAKLSPSAKDLDVPVVSADIDIFDLNADDLDAWPDQVAIEGENKTLALISKELITLLLRSAPPFMPQILENCPTGVVVIDRESRIIFANQSYTDILAVPRQRIMGRRMDKLEPQADILKVLLEGVPLYNHLSHIKSADRHVRVNIFPLCQGSQVSGAVSFFTDVSETAFLSAALDRANTLADHLKRELDDQRELPKGLADIIGRNRHFLEALKTAGTVAATNAPILILGEYGVGKEVLARAVHNVSSRREKAFVTVNCAAIPETLMESELFGYTDGAFTGAKRGGSLGKFELAEGGTLFLDEIGDMTLAMQAKMLRALQEKEIEKIGRKSLISVDVRILAATKRNLTSMIEAGQFRADFYYRLNMVTVTIPPLRYRKDDLPLLMESILGICGKKYGKNLEISPQLLVMFENHDWPGNIRELVNTLEYAVIMCTGQVIGPQHLPAQFTAMKGEIWKNNSSETNHQNQTAGQSKRSSEGLFLETKTLDNQAAKSQDDLSEFGSRGWKETIRQTEYKLLTQAIDQSGQNRSKAIRLLGLSRKTFYAKLNSTTLTSACQNDLHNQNLTGVKDDYFTF
jgi:transcriptional regulator with PAS, ATPase and Fis domain